MHYCARILCFIVLAVSAADAAETRAKTAKAQAVQRPNVILITLDTVRADHVGCYGYKNIKTPAIDSLAADGIRFERAYATNPTTLPSHSTILTGTYPMLHGMHDFSGNKLSPMQPTLATIFKQQGYATGAVIGAAVLDSRFGLNNGFDLYYDDFDFSRLAESNLDAMERPGNLVVDKALSWLQQNSRAPFLLWIHLYDPHYPYTPPEPFATEYASSLYDGEIAFADSQVARVIRFLKNEGLYAKTVIAVSGDHGEGLGEHGEKTHGFFIYNSTMRVPLIFKPASYSAPVRKVANEPVSLVDLLPTVLWLANVPSPAGLQGKSLFPGMNSAAETPRTSASYSETYLPRLHFNWSELRGLHREQYHFIDGPKPELYDLDKDPMENKNLFATKPAVSQQLRASLVEIIRNYTPEKELAEKTSLDPAMAERLKALGYAAVPSGNNPTLSNQNLPDPKDRIHIYELIAEGIDDSQHARYDESITKLQEALKTEPNSTPVHYLLGLNFYRKHEFPAAQRELTRVLELSPEYALAAYYLGLSYVGTADWDAAIKEFQKALQLDPTNHAAAYNLGAAYVQKRMFPAAIESMKQAVSIYPGYVQAWRSLGDIYLFEGDPDNAILSLNEAAKIEPRDPRIFMSLSRAYQAKGMSAEAMKAQRAAEQLRGVSPN